MKRILFVCHGNICRSPMAEYIMKKIIKDHGDDHIYVESKATSREEIGNDIYPYAKTKLREKGIPFDRHHARQVEASDYDRFDLIIGMDSYNIRNLERSFDDKYHKIRKLNTKDVSDPWYSGDFETAYQEIYDGCIRLYDELSSM